MTAKELVNSLSNMPPDAEVRIKYWDKEYGQYRHSCLDRVNMYNKAVILE